MTTDPTDRTVLPPPAPEFAGAIDDTYKTSTPDWAPALPLTAPTGAPNVIVMLLDDVGFGQLGCYGGPVETPNIERWLIAACATTTFTPPPCARRRGARY